MAKTYKAVVILLFFFLAPIAASAATLSISPASGTPSVGDVMVVKVVASSAAPFNAVSGSVSIPSSIFSIESVSKAGSILNFWVTEPTSSKSAGTVRFEGVTLGGYNGSSGTIATIYLKAKAVGQGTVSFTSGQILANDGQGTDITGALNGGYFTVKQAVAKPATPKPESTPDPAEVPQPTPTLEAPEIVFGTKYGADAIVGTSQYNDSQVLLTFVAPDGGKVFLMGTTDTHGEFSILIPHSLKRGTYTVSAVVVKNDKTNSKPSNTITITIGSIFSDVSREIWILIALLILMIMYLLVRTYHHFGPAGSLGRRDNKREIREAENIIHKSFDILREDVIDYNNEKLTAAEHKRMAAIKKDVNDAEKVIAKEIKDIESQ